MLSGDPSPPETVTDAVTSSSSSSHTTEKRRNLNDVLQATERENKIRNNHKLAFNDFNFADMQMDSLAAKIKIHKINLDATKLKDIFNGHTITKGIKSNMKLLVNYIDKYVTAEDMQKLKKYISLDDVSDVYRIYREAAEKFYDYMMEKFREFDENGIDIGKSYKEEARKREIETVKLENGFSCCKATGHPTERK